MSECHNARAARMSEFGNSVTPLPRELPMFAHHYNYAAECFILMIYLRARLNNTALIDTRAALEPKSDSDFDSE